MTRTRTLLALGLFAAPLPAQEPDLAAAERELAHVFDRPVGTPIGAEQKAKLAALLERFEGRDLGHLGYARALQLYLDRDYDGAVAALDGFFARHPQIGNREHATMAGRIYLNGLSRQARAAEPDMERIARWSTGVTRLYDDADLLVRMAHAIGPRLPDPAAFRVALARGVFASDWPAAKKDGFLRDLYGEAPAVPPRAAGAAGRASGGPEVGAQIEPFAAEAVLGAEAFDLLALRGKVVVLDFFATWCPPCRASVPALVELQKAHPGDLQVVAVTRFYGRGMDFSDPAAERPHGGKPASGLDREQELQVNRAFRAAFGTGYPVVFAAQEVAARFGVRGIPAVFVIGRDGALVGSVVGGGEDNHARLQALVAEALGAKGPEPVRKG